MKDTLCQYRLLSSGLVSIKKQIKEELQLSEDGNDRFVITYFDTFDWEIYRNNAVLELIRRGHQRKLCWREFNSNEECYKTTFNDNAVVDYVRNLPSGKLKAHLKKTLGDRAMMKVATVMINRQMFVKRNKDEKIVLRFQFDEYKLLNQKTGKFRLFGKRIILIPLRGYTSALTRVKAKLANKPQLMEVRSDIALEILEHCGFKPDDQSVKPGTTLVGELSTDTSARLILRDLFETVTRNGEGILDKMDTEGLHGFRIAVRKTRSLLTQLNGVFDASTLKKYKMEFKWLGSITTQARDMDVYLQEFEDYRLMLPEQMREHLVSLQRIILKKQQYGYEKLFKALKSKRYLQLKQGYKEFLYQPLINRSALRNAEIPVKQVINQRIWKLYKKVLKEGSAINENSPSEQLHELRKMCKKLRYMIEIFKMLYEKNKIRDIIRELKKLQDNLGDFNDLNIQCNTLRVLVDELKNDAALEDDSKSAMEYLIRYLQELSKKARSEFSTHFNEFSQTHNQRAFHKLFKPGKKDPSRLA